MKSILVERVAGKLQVVDDYGRDIPSPFPAMTDEQVHTYLSSQGYKRVGKAEGDKLAGAYVQPSKEGER